MDGVLVNLHIWESGWLINLIRQPLGQCTTGLYLAFYCFAIISPGRYVCGISSVIALMMQEPGFESRSAVTETCEVLLLNVLIKLGL